MQPEKIKNKLEIRKIGIFVTKIVLTSVGKKRSSDRKKLKFEAEGQDFVNFLRSLAQFIQ